MEAQTNDPILSHAMNVKATLNAKSDTTFKGYVSHTGKSFEAENLEDLYAEIKNHIPINLEVIGVDDRPDDWEHKPIGHSMYYKYWMVKLKEKNELGNDYDYYLRGFNSYMFGNVDYDDLHGPAKKQAVIHFVASCDAEEKKNWYDDVLANSTGEKEVLLRRCDDQPEHLTHGYLEITKVVTTPTPVVGPVVASRKRGAPTPDVAPDVAPEVDSARKRAKSAVQATAAKVFHTQSMYQHATRVSEYQVISFYGSASMVEKLNEQVNKMMKEGWQPLGGPCSSGQCIKQW